MKRWIVDRVIGILVVATVIAALFVILSSPPSF
jgi:hypothetical protein